MPFASRTFSRIISDLVDKGFVELAGYGGLRGFCKSYNKFKISNRWRQYGQQSFVPLEALPFRTVKNTGGWLAYRKTFHSGVGKDWFF